MEVLIDATLSGDGSIQSQWCYGWAPAMGMRSVKCLAALGQPWERPWYAHFYTPLPKRLGKPKSEIQSSNYSNISKPFPLTDCLKARWMQLRTLLLKPGTERRPNTECCDPSCGRKLGAGGGMPPSGPFKNQTRQNQHWTQDAEMSTQRSRARRARRCRWTRR